ncbi:MAG TPA: hypothetical protein VIB78_06585 [Acidimicrobiia bacterium]|jgi:hypothetical protein
MSRDSVGIVTGLAVLIAGVFAVARLLSPAAEKLAESPPPSMTILTVAEPSASLVTTTPDLPGVGPAITRVLQWSGNARLASTADLAQLPPSVSATLGEYGVPLRVPTGPGDKR